MSVDYDANYGIGYQVDAEESLLEAFDGPLIEYIDSELGSDFISFEVGSYMTGDITGTYVAIKDPFSDGLDLSSKKEKLDAELKRLNVQATGDFGQHGGLLIW
jgi:hypothetical protein